MNLKSLDEIAKSADEAGVFIFSGEVNTYIEETPFSTDAFFQPAFLGMCVLVVLRKWKKQRSASEVVRLVLEVVAQSYPRFVVDSKELKNSITLRRRIADAICILESLKMVKSDDAGYIQVEAAGKFFLNSQVKIKGKKSDLIQGLERSLAIVKSNT